MGRPRAQMIEKKRFEPLAKAVLRTQPDARLVALVRKGSEPAFDEIVRRYRPALVPFAAAYASSASAEDVVQESLIRAWDAIRDSDPDVELALKPWLFTIVRNRALNSRRDTRVHQPLDETIDGVHRPEDHLLQKEQLGEAVAAVKALPDAQREALVRSSLEGHGHAQIAAALGSTPGAVRGLIFRARTTLREGLGLVLPLPLVRALLELGGGHAGGLAAGGAGAGAAISSGGGPLTIKLIAIAAVGAAGAGAGIAIDRDRKENGSPHTTSVVEAATPGAARAVREPALSAGASAAGIEQAADRGRSGLPSAAVVSAAGDGASAVLASAGEAENGTAPGGSTSTSAGGDQAGGGRGGPREDDPAPPPPTGGTGDHSGHDDGDEYEDRSEPDGGAPPPTGEEPPEDDDSEPQDPESDPEADDAPDGHHDSSGPGSGDDD